MKDKIGNDGKVTPEEFDETGKQTGEFKSNRETDADKNGAEIEGEWKKPTGSATQSFWAFEQMIFFTDDVKIRSKTTSEENKKRRWNLTKKGLQITFDAYQVAAYAAGLQTVIIPYSELNDSLTRGCHNLQIICFLVILTVFQ